MPYKDPIISKEKSQERWKSWSERNPEKANARMREWRQRNQRYMLRSSAKIRAKREGVEFCLELIDIPEIPETCPIALIPIHPRQDGKQGPCDNSPTLDKVNPSKGYVPGNVRVISFKGNRWKSDMNIETIERLLAYSKGEI